MRDFVDVIQDGTNPYGAGFESGWFNPEIGSSVDDDFPRPRLLNIGDPSPAARVQISWLQMSLGTVAPAFKFYTGSTWVVKPLKVWNGTSWISKPVKSYYSPTWN